MTRLDEPEAAKAALLERAAEVAGRAHGGEMSRERALAFLHRYYLHVSPHDLVGRDPVDVYGAAMSHKQLAATRPQGTARVRVFTPSLDEQGWSSGHTVVEVVTDDMPFLVDSVTAELNRQGRAIHLVIHPQLYVRRTVTGELEEVLDLADLSATPPPGTELESWIHVEIDRETDEKNLEQVAADLRRVLRDVREAVEDWPKMRGTALRIAEELQDDPPPLPEAEIAEAAELMRWLADEHFTFLGYREYDLVPDDHSGDGAEVLRPVPGTGLGILRSDKPVSNSFGKLSPQVRAKAHEQRVLVLSKASSRSTVHRSVYLDYVGVKRFDDQGRVVGERRFLGLLTSSAYIESVTRIPVVRRRVQELFDRAGFPVMSHSGKDMLEILETFPRDELFQTDTDQLLPVVTAVLHLRERRQLRLFLRRDDYDRFVSCLVYLPRDRYTTAVRLKMERILLDALGGTAVDYTARVSESVLARLHFVVRMPSGRPLPDVDVAELEQRLVEATRTWSDDFSEAILDQCGEESAAALLRVYGDAFPEAYKEDFPARTAVADLKRLAALGDDPSALDLNLYEPYGAPPDERRFKVYRVGSPISLARVLPVLQEMGVEVVDERPYGIERRDGVTAWIYDFGMRYRGEVPEGPVKDRFQEAFAALWRGRAEVDGFNALVLQGGLGWRQAAVLRAYAKYMRQGGSTFSQDYIEDSLLSHVNIARLLVQLFEARLDPPPQGDADPRQVDGLVRQITAALDQVASLDRDRILRTFLAMILATLRTNYFQTDDAGNPKSWMSFKLDSMSIPDLPMPRPRYEIWVYSPRVEGVHLRFGPVARGGLRWSDRREDFRTEVLGLVKAQMVKNAVIVPVGAKGGFVVKQPSADPTDREAVLAEGVECYTTFIRGLLDITDNRVAGQIEPPPDVVRHDGDDPYLVVAADKGTATFSDIANSVADEYGFWLGDAFASGGSSGYDHKAMGITARGAWVSVQRHFRDMGVDCQREDFTVVGIGDMSGDVFGNGMLLSKHIRLIAAFDHRHIFLDPSPDAAASFKERQRLFELPRSSWADYDTALISPGGGVYPRDAKSIPVSPEVCAALGIEALDDEVDGVTPHELMHAILLAPVDLLWNGGIGTYVKASTETNADVGDKANDSIRVDGNQLRCKAVGEGGNLGLTQLGRVEYALAGGRINTDAIDNSAGVDTSDHEVNIKILLDRIVDNGDLTVKQRNSLLAEMTDEVAALVLRDNYGQNVAIACGLWQAPSLVEVHARYLRFLERRGYLNRSLEFLPTDRQLAERRAQGRGVTSPEFAVMLSYTKIAMKRELLESDLPEDPYLQTELEAYFPSPLREQFAAQIAAHPLRREIITTCVVNNVVNNAGTTFGFRLSDETGASADELARAHTIARVVFDMQTLWQGIEALDSGVESSIQTRMRLVGRTIVERASRWLVNNRRPPIDIAKTIEQFRAGVSEVVASMPNLLVGLDLEQFQARRDMLLEHGVPEELAIRVSSMPPAFAALSIVETAASRARSIEEVARLHFYLGEELRLGLLLERIIALPRDDRWQTMARAAMRDDLHSAHAALTAEVLESGPDGATPEQRLSEWRERSASVVGRAEATLDEVADSDTSDLAMLSVALRAIRTLVGSRTRS